MQSNITLSINALKITLHWQIWDFNHGGPSDTARPLIVLFQSQKIKLSSQTKLMIAIGILDAVHQFFQPKEMNQLVFSVLQQARFWCCLVLDHQGNSCYDSHHHDLAFSPQELDNGDVHCVREQLGDMSRESLPAASEISEVCSMSLRIGDTNAQRSARRMLVELSITHDLCMQIPNMPSGLAPNACPHSVSRALPIPH